MLLCPNCFRKISLMNTCIDLACANTESSLCNYHLNRYVYITSARLLQRKLCLNVGLTNTQFQRLRFHPHLYSRKHSEVELWDQRKHSKLSSTNTNLGSVMPIAFRAAGNTKPVPHTITAVLDLVDLDGSDHRFSEAASCTTSCTSFDTSDRFQSLQLNHKKFVIYITCILVLLALCSGCISQPPVT